MKRRRTRTLAEQFIAALKINESTRDYKVYGDGIELVTQIENGTDITRLESIFQDAPYSAHDIINIVSAVLSMFQQGFYPQQGTKYYPLES